MENFPQQHVGPVLVFLTRAALALLFVGVIGAQILIVMTGQSMVKAFPEFADIHAPLVTAAIMFGVCVEVILVITAILVGYIRDDRIFGSSSLRLVDIMAACLAVATVIMVATLFLIPGPPALALLLVGAVLVGATLTLVLVVLRSLLRKAVFMRTELDVVV